MQINEHTPQTVLKQFVREFNSNVIYLYTLTTTRTTTTTTETTIFIDSFYGYWLIYKIILCEVGGRGGRQFSLELMCSSKRLLSEDCQFKKNRQRARKEVWKIGSVGGRERQGVWKREIAHFGKCGAWIWPRYKNVLFAYLCRTCLSKENRCCAWHSQYEAG